MSSLRVPTLDVSLFRARVDGVRARLLALAPDLAGPELAELIAREAGKPLWEARTEVDAVIDAAANASVLAGVDGFTSSRQLVEHNLIGTDLTGTAAVRNLWTGVVVDSRVRILPLTTQLLSGLVSPKISPPPPPPALELSGSGSRMRGPVKSGIAKRMSETS